MRTSVVLKYHNHNYLFEVLSLLCFFLWCLIAGLEYWTDFFFDAVMFDTTLYNVYGSGVHGMCPRL